MERSRVKVKAIIILFLVLYVKAAPTTVSNESAIPTTTPTTTNLINDKLNSDIVKHKDVNTESPSTESIIETTTIIDGKLKHDDSAKSEIKAPNKKAMEDVIINAIKSSASIMSMNGDDNYAIMFNNGVSNQMGRVKIISNIKNPPKPEKSEIDNSKLSPQESSSADGEKRNKKVLVKKVLINTNNGDIKEEKINSKASDLRILSSTKEETSGSTEDLKVNNLAKSSESKDSSSSSSELIKNKLPELPPLIGSEEKIVKNKTVTLKIKKLKKEHVSTEAIEATKATPTDSPQNDYDIAFTTREFASINPTSIPSEDLTEVPTTKKERDTKSTDVKNKSFSSETRDGKIRVKIIKLSENEDNKEKLKDIETKTRTRVRGKQKFNFEDFVEKSEDENNAAEAESETENYPDLTHFKKRVEEVSQRFQSHRVPQVRERDLIPPIVKQLLTEISSKDKDIPTGTPIKFKLNDYNSDTATTTETIATTIAQKPTLKYTTIDRKKNVNANAETLQKEESSSLVSSLRSSSFAQQPASSRENSNIVNKFVGAFTGSDSQGEYSTKLNSGNGQFESNQQINVRGTQGTQFSAEVSNAQINRGRGSIKQSSSENSETTNINFTSRRKLPDSGIVEDTKSETIRGNVRKVVKKTGVRLNGDDANKSSDENLTRQRGSVFSTFTEDTTNTNINQGNTESATTSTFSDNIRTSTRRGFIAPSASETKSEEEFKRVRKIVKKIGNSLNEIQNGSSLLQTDQSSSQNTVRTSQRAQSSGEQVDKSLPSRSRGSIKSTSAERYDASTISTTDIDSTSFPSRRRLPSLTGFEDVKSEEVIKGTKRKIVKVSKLNVKLDGENESSQENLTKQKGSSFENQNSAFGSNDQSIKGRGSQETQFNNDAANKSRFTTLSTLSVNENVNTSRRGSPTSSESNAVNSEKEFKRVRKIVKKVETNLNEVQKNTTLIQTDQSSSQNKVRGSQRSQTSSEEERVNINRNRGSIKLSSAEIGLDNSKSGEEITTGVKKAENAVQFTIKLDDQKNIINKSSDENLTIQRGSYFGNQRGAQYSTEDVDGVKLTKTRGSIKSKTVESNEGTTISTNYDATSLPSRRRLPISAKTETVESKEEVTKLNDSNKEGRLRIDLSNNGGFFRNQNIGISTSDPKTTVRESQGTQFSTNEQSVVNKVRGSAKQSNDDGTYTSSDISSSSRKRLPNSDVTSSQEIKGGIKKETKSYQSNVQFGSDFGKQQGSIRSGSLIQNKSPGISSTTSSTPLKSTFKSNDLKQKNVFIQNNSESTSRPNDKTLKSVASSSINESENKLQSSNRATVSRGKKKYEPSIFETISPFFSDTHVNQIFRENGIIINGRTNPELNLTRGELSYMNSTFYKSAVRGSEEERPLNRTNSNVSLSRNRAKSSYFNQRDNKDSAQTKFRTNKNGEEIDSNLDVGFSRLNESANIGSSRKTQSHKLRGSDSAASGNESQNKNSRLNGSDIESQRFRGSSGANGEKENSRGKSRNNAYSGRYDDKDSFQPIPDPSLRNGQQGNFKFSTDNLDTTSRSRGQLNNQQFGTANVDQNSNRGFSRGRSGSRNGAFSENESNDDSFKPIPDPSIYRKSSGLNTNEQNKDGSSAGGYRDGSISQTTTFNSQNSRQSTSSNTFGQTNPPSQNSASTGFSNGFGLSSKSNSLSDGVNKNENSEKTSISFGTSRDSESTFGSTNPSTIGTTSTSGDGKKIIVIGIGRTLKNNTDGSLTTTSFTSPSISTDGNDISSAKKSGNSVKIASEVKTSLEGSFGGFSQNINNQKTLTETSRGKSASIQSGSSVGSDSGDSSKIGINVQNNSGTTSNVDGSGVGTSSGGSLTQGKRYGYSFQYEPSTSNSSQTSTGGKTTNADGSISGSQTNKNNAGSSKEIIGFGTSGSDTSSTGLNRGSASFGTTGGSSLSNSGIDSSISKTSVSGSFGSNSASSSSQSSTNSGQPNSSGFGLGASTSGSTSGKSSSQSNIPSSTSVKSDSFGSSLSFGGSDGGLGKSKNAEPSRGSIGFGATGGGFGSFSSQGSETSKLSGQGPTSGKSSSENDIISSNNAVNGNFVSNLASGGSITNSPTNKNSAGLGSSSSSSIGSNSAFTGARGNAKGTGSGGVDSAFGSTGGSSSLSGGSNSAFTGVRGNTKGDGSGGVDSAFGSTGVSSSLSGGSNSAFTGVRGNTKVTGSDSDGSAFGSTGGSSSLSGGSNSAFTGVRGNTKGTGSGGVDSAFGSTGGSSSLSGGSNSAFTGVRGNAKVTGSDSDGSAFGSTGGSSSLSGGSNSTFTGVRGNTKGTGSDSDGSAFGSTGGSSSLSGGSNSAFIGVRGNAKGDGSGGVGSAFGSTGGSSSLSGGSNSAFINARGNTKGTGSDSDGSAFGSTGGSSSLSGGSNSAFINVRGNAKGDGSGGDSSGFGSTKSSSSTIGSNLATLELQTTSYGAGLNKGSSGFGSSGSGVSSNVGTTLASNGLQANGNNAGSGKGNFGFGSTGGGSFSNIETNTNSTGSSRGRTVFGTTVDGSSIGSNTGSIGSFGKSSFGTSESGIIVESGTLKTTTSFGSNSASSGFEAKSNSNESSRDNSGFAFSNLGATKTKLDGKSSSENTVNSGGSAIGGNFGLTSAFDGSQQSKNNAGANRGNSAFGSSYGADDDSKSSKTTASDNFRTGGSSLSTGFGSRGSSNTLSSSTSGSGLLKTGTVVDSTSSASNDARGGILLQSVSGANRNSGSGIRSSISGTASGASGFGVSQGSTSGPQGALNDKSNLDLTKNSYTNSNAFRILSSGISQGESGTKTVRSSSESLDSNAFNLNSNVGQSKNSGKDSASNLKVLLNGAYNIESNESGDQVIVKDSKIKYSANGSAKKSGSTPAASVNLARANENQLPTSNGNGLAVDASGSLAEALERGSRKFTPSKFETISPYVTDSHLRQLYSGNNLQTSKANEFSLSTTKGGSLNGVNELSDLDKSNSGSNQFRGSVRYKWDPHNPEWIYDDDTDDFRSQFTYNYKTSNGISAYQKGVLKAIDDHKVFVVSGSYQYTSPDGTPITVVYTADEHGFHPKVISPIFGDSVAELKDFDEYATTEIFQDFD